MKAQKFEEVFVNFMVSGINEDQVKFFVSKIMHFFITISKSLMHKTVLLMGLINCSRIKYYQHY